MYWLLAAAIGALAGAFGSSLLPSTLVEGLQYGFNRRLPHKIPDVSTLVRLRLLGKLSDEVYFELMKEWGFDSPRALQILDAAQNYLTAAEVVRAYYREKGPGKPSEADIKAIAQELINRGFSEEDAEKFALIAHPYPSPSDIITWAVREVFDPHVVERWGLMQGYSEAAPQLEKWGRAVGWTPEILRYYWAAHWQWPSPTQAAEFVHRTNVKWWNGPKFSPEDYDMILRLADYVPGTIPLFRSTLYRPFTRVDVRRMHKLGVLEPEDLKDAYKELGYDDWHAEKLAEFTIKYNADEEPSEERVLTRSLIERAYDLGLLNRSEAKQALQEIGYSEEKAEFVVSVIDMDKTMDQADDLTRVYMNQFRYDIIDEGTLRAKLQGLGLSDDMVEHYVHVAKELRERQEKIPSKSDIKNLYKYGYISRQEAKNALLRMGFSAYWAEKLLQ
ncbi:MAG: hypothetical protein DRO11_07650, partial [Methanobacteriota archaeon]